MQIQLGRVYTTRPGIGGCASCGIGCVDCGMGCNCGMGALTDGQKALAGAGIVAAVVLAGIGYVAYANRLPRGVSGRRRR